ncbi:uncharacterized protein ARMOST_05942 [Armillaria ostoyae]|uniref:Thioesterase domain-containing protein n=1 Tax=Armillaria ostoyae TaxID=47428 RepID=A0A284R1M5_ARMOS|nr:uncharacterized protein ARMOST_05942 [Armillaria ostoyae]
MSSIPRSFLHSLPAAPHIDVSTIKGNISDEEKQLGANIFSYFVNSREESYGAEVGRRLRLVEMNIWGRDACGTAAQGQTIFEIDVEKGASSLHVQCLWDLARGMRRIYRRPVRPLVPLCLGWYIHIVHKEDLNGGTKLRVVSTSVFIHGRIRTARCELWDKERDKLYVSAIHTTVNNTRPSLAKL